MLFILHNALHTQLDEEHGRLETVQLLLNARIVWRETSRKPFLLLIIGSPLWHLSLKRGVFTFVRIDRDTYLDSVHTGAMWETLRIQCGFPYCTWITSGSHCPMRTAAGFYTKLMTPPDQIAVRTVNLGRNRIAWVRIKKFASHRHHMWSAQQCAVNHMRCLTLQ